jgi:ribosomal protein L31
MKTIQPISVWFNGSSVEATVINASAKNDDLKSSAVFQYQLLTTDGSPENHPFFTAVSQGEIVMSGDVYDAWETNDYAYNWIASKLNLVITGDYVYPVQVTETTQESTEQTTEG